jgi:DNA modification methylase
MIKQNTIYIGDALKRLKYFPDGFIDCCVTSPPYYGLRDYGHPDQIGLEVTPELYVQKLVRIFAEVKRVLKSNGTLWLNLGDSYAGSGKASGQKPEHKRGYDVTKATPSKAIGLKPKDLIGIPWMVAFALRADGWYLRQDIIWHKPNPMPESVTDRCTKSHEYIFLLSKSQKYYYDYKAVLEPAKFDGRKDTKFKGSAKYKDSGQTFAERGHERWPNKMAREGTNIPGHSGYYSANGKILIHFNEEGIPARNKRDVWTVNTKPFKGAHFAVFPEALIEPCILAGCPENGIVLDPFIGSGTTAIVAKRLHRNYIGIELNSKYLPIIESRLFGKYHFQRGD